MTHQPAISFSISFLSPFNRAGGRTSYVVQKMKTPSKDFLVVMALIGGLVTALGIWGSGIIKRPHFSHTRAGRVHQELLDISRAVNDYQTEMNSDPPLPTKEFYASLEGANPKGIKFLISGRFRESVEGLRCDAWRTPYHVYMSSDDWLIRSAGPNRCLDDIKNRDKNLVSDDISISVPRVVKQEAQPQR